MFKFYQNYCFLGLFFVSFLGVKIWVDAQNLSPIIPTFVPPKTVNPSPLIPPSSSPTSPSSVLKKLPNLQSFDVIVYGDELPGICAAIWAKKTLGNQGKVALVRPDSATAMLGGVLTRGGLAYLDLDKTPGWYSQPYSQCFRTFLQKARVRGSCVEAKAAHWALKMMLAEAKVTLISEAKITPIITRNKIEEIQTYSPRMRLMAESFIDGSQDGELARKAGLSYYQGYESQQPNLKDETLSISVIPVIEGLSIWDLRQIENKILADHKAMVKIKNNLEKTEDRRTANFWLTNFWKPVYRAYKDGYYMRSIALGASYHYAHQLPFDTHGFFFDKANICALSEQRLSWNGFLFKSPVSDLLKMEESGRKPTQEMLKMMASLERWLNRVSGKKVKFIIPPETYIRHTLNIKEVVDPLTGQEMIRGGNPPEKSFGTFSYEFDLRGGVRGLSISIPPLPFFNFGIENTLASTISNLAVVSRSSGYVGMGVSVGRILTLNIYQGQGVGVAAGIAHQLRIPLNQITSLQVKQGLEKLTGKRTKFRGKNTSKGQDYRSVK